MPPIEEPTLGEVMRVCQTLVTEMAGLRAEIKQDRADIAKTYVRQDVYMAERQAAQAVVSDLHGDIRKVEADLGRKIQQIQEDLKAEKASRRQVWLAISTMAIALLSIFVTIIIAIVR